MSKKWLPLIVLFAPMLIYWQNISAQGASTVKIKRCLLKGSWQLTQTYAVGTLHAVNKTEYDGIIHFGPLHKYYEEVNYESSHWIIKGKWFVDRKKGTLLLNNRAYTLGKLEDHPADILLTVFEADKKHWAGSTTDKGQPVKVYYTKISKSKTAQ